ncbi:MAG: cupin domain-containing protein [Verrucomicrobia bacterium]|nr:cupin domain-containing protein [Verrucomicrobiota bacterium]
MQKLNLQHLPEQERRSPGGKYHAFIQAVSVALGREPDSLDLTKRHPFDLSRVRLPPGATLCPYHAHSAQWELYVIISGQGRVRDEHGFTEVVAGDAFVFRPGEAHQMSNAGSDDLVYWVLADNPVGESCHYPDSSKWAVVKGFDRQVIKGTSAAYFDGEE